jgi:integrative and conjugative element protein (TIGR02256 family)
MPDLRHAHVKEVAPLVYFPSDVVAVFENLIATCRDQPEQGGILIGAVRGPHLEVTEITEAGALDIRGRYRFVRQDPLHQKRASDRWNASRQTETFLGEWHTHPQGDGQPSGTDISTWARLVRLSARAMCFVILAPERRRVFVAEPTALGSRPIELDVVERSASGVTMGNRA